MPNPSVVPQPIREVSKCTCPENNCNGDGETGRILTQVFPNTTVPEHCPCDGHSEYLEDHPHGKSNAWPNPSVVRKPGRNTLVQCALCQKRIRMLQIPHSFVAVCLDCWREIR